MKGDIGVIGLAVMGQNLILNMNDKGFKVVAYNRTVSKVDDFLNGAAKNTNIIGAYSIPDLVEKLEKPRKIMLVVRAGTVVDDFIAQLLPHLEEGDIIIDGGNANFPDSTRRTHELAAKGIRFIGAGVSGGEEGARNGPSIMPGGSEEAWPFVKPILQAISAKTPQGEPCCDWVGRDGAGHFVKMVHNGIEYGDMQLICEAYQFMKDGLGMSADEMQQTFAAWNKTELNSYLIEITADILAYKDSDGLPLYADAHTKTFREAVELLHRNPALQRAASLRFLPAVGPLHALMLKAKLSAEHGFRPSENDVRPTNYFTVRFHPNEKGKLQAQIRPLSDGLYPDRPNGLFLHKKAAKRALDAWACEQQFCPAELNILPPGYDRNAPCPVAAVGRCQGQCGNIGEAAQQRQRIKTAARLLPVCDWGKAHQIEICETDTLNGRRLSFHCAGGALQMPDGSWYFDRKLPAVFKEKFRAHRNDIAVSF